MKIKRFNHSTVEYFPNTGWFFWVSCYKKPWMNGKQATHETPNGYLYIKADGKMHSASRLAYELMDGNPIPQGMEIDHINRNKQDNRIINLRIVDRKGNLANARRYPGISGHLGISVYNRPSGNGCLWRTRKGGITKYYQTLEEAVAGYAKLGAEACQK